MYCLITCWKVFIGKIYLAIRYTIPNKTRNDTKIWLKK
jgi:hypothetical protein